MRPRETPAQGVCELFRRSTTRNNVHALDAVEHDIAAKRERSSPADGSGLRSANAGRRAHPEPITRS